MVVSPNGEGVVFVSWFARVPWSALEAVSFMLMGLGAAWAGMHVAHINRASAPNPDMPLDPDIPPTRRWSPTETWLWRFAWITIGLGFNCLGLTALRYSKGQYIVVPPNAPLIDHVIWLSSFVCWGGGFALLYALAMTSTVRARRTRREDVGS